MATEFLSRFLLLLPEWSLRVRVRHLLDLYQDLSVLFTSICGAQGLAFGPVLQDQLVTPVGYVRDGVVTSFPRLVKRDVRRILLPTFLHLPDHPISHHRPGASYEIVLQTIQALKNLRRLVLPVYADLQFRLCWKLLPTKSRFWFLQRTSSTALHCGYPACFEVETDKHLFFDCPRVVSLWEIIQADWSHFLSGVHWDMVCLPMDPLWSPSAVPFGPELNQLWNIVRSVTLHVIWTSRNKHYFEDQDPLEASSAIYRVYAIFSAHFRYLLRSSGTTELQRLYSAVFAAFRLIPG